MPLLSWGTEGCPGFLTEIHTQYLEMLYLNCVSSLVSIQEHFRPTGETILKQEAELLKLASFNSTHKTNSKQKQAKIMKMKDWIEEAFGRL